MPRGFIKRRRFGSQTDTEPEVGSHRSGSNEDGSINELAAAPKKKKKKNQMSNDVRITGDQEVPRNA